MSIDVFAAADAAVEGLRPAIAARQNAYAAEHGGRYWQGLRSHGSPPPDGALWHATVGSAVPTDQLMEWPAVIHDHALPVALTVDVYDGPAGQGYVLRSEVEVAGTTYHKADVFGPETWRAFDWTPTPSALSGVSIGTPTASATYNSILVDLPLTEAGGELSGAALRYRPAGELAWRDWLPLHPLRPGGEPSRLQGSLIDLTAGTTYDLEITVSDDLNGLERVTLQAATRAEDIPSHAELLTRVTHYVRLDGSDSNDGLTPETAWRTVNKVRLAAPAEAVVLIGSGDADEHFAGSGSATLKATGITLIAPYPAADDDGNPINAGKRTIIDGNLTCGPAGADTDGVIEAPWVALGNGVWRWPDAWAAVGSSFGAQVGSAAWSTERDGTYKRLWCWDNRPSGGDPLGLLLDPTTWQTLLLENLTFNYGYWKDPNSDDLYVRMEGDIDPNTAWITFGHGAAFGIGAPDSRVSGLVFRGWYRALNVNGLASRLVVDHCRIDCCTYSILPSGANGDTIPVDPVVERNYIRDTGLSLAGPDETVAAPWAWVKVGVMTAASSPDYAITSKPGGKCEGMAIRWDGARRLVARHNRIEGTFNGVSTDNPSNRNRYTGSEWDVHDNWIRWTADDSLEPPTAGNWRGWRNRSEKCLTWISSGPSAGGPSYFWDNIAHRCGTNAYLARWADGRVDPEAASIAIKHSGSSDPQTRWYLWNDTFWNDVPGSNFADPQASGGGSSPEWLVLWNCIIRTGGDCLNAFVGQYTADYNQYGAPASETRGFRVIQPNGAVRRYTFADYRLLVPNQDAHSNVAIPDHTDLATLDAQFVDAQGGDLRLVAESVLRGVGVAVPGLIVGGADLGAADEVARLRPL